MYLVRYNLQLLKAMLEEVKTHTMKCINVCALLKKIVDVVYLTLVHCKSARMLHLASNFGTCLVISLQKSGATGLVDLDTYSHVIRLWVKDVRDRSNQHSSLEVSQISDSEVRVRLII